MEGPYFSDCSIWVPWNGRVGTTSPWVTGTGTGFLRGERDRNGWPGGAAAGNIYGLMVTTTVSE